MSAKKHVNNSELHLVENHSIFRAMLRFRISAGDKTLEDHVFNCYAKATSQNKLILCCKEEIQSIMFVRVRNTVAYAIIFDETTDIARVVLVPTITCTVLFLMFSIILLITYFLD